MISKKSLKNRTPGLYVREWVPSYRSRGFYLLMMFFGLCLTEYSSVTFYSTSGMSEKNSSNESFQHIRDHTSPRKILLTLYMKTFTSAPNPKACLTSPKLPKEHWIVGSSFLASAFTSFGQFDVGKYWHLKLILDGVIVVMICGNVCHQRAIR